MLPAALLVTYTVGALSGMAFVLFVTVRPLERKLRDRDRDDLRTARRMLYRHNARQHFGTPYRDITVQEAIAKLSPVVDDHIGSRRAPSLRAVK